MARTVQGQMYKWQLSDTPIGSGDAGEVYAATCIEQPDLHGVMKTPARIATTGTIQRQAGQIAQERRALARLDGLPRGKVHPPRLLDEAQAYTQGTANYFIISETAPGENFASMLAQSRQMGKPFPHRVIITVLDALFDLFARTHRAGVLWNDVKLDHIYWHNPTGEIGVIDWGNALFLDDEVNKGQRTPPRWQDYHQLVSTLGGFLQHSAPDLYEDLGWSEFQEGELDSPRVSVLARRIAYQQQVLALKEMEYQSLIRVVLNSEPTLDSLGKIQEYTAILDQIGAPWPCDDILKFGQSLVETALSNGDTPAAIKATALVWEVFSEALDLSWHLVREYLRQPDILSHPSLANLVKFTFNENWSLVIWTLASIAREIGNPKWWSQMIPVIHQKALGITEPRPIQFVQSLLNWLMTHRGEKKDAISSLNESLANWHTRGEDFLESPFEYAVLDLALDEYNFPQGAHFKLKRSFSAGEEAIRELIKGWVNIAWDELPKAFHLLLSWDPDRWGILTLQEGVQDFQDWMKRLYMGPNPEEDAAEFIQNSIQSFPPLDTVLGRPSWFRRLMTMLSAIQGGAAIKDHQVDVQIWCPWILKFPTIQAAAVKPHMLEKELDLQVIDAFVDQLKSWRDVEVGLQDIKQKAPPFHPCCLKLADGFNHALALNFDPLRDETPNEDSIPAVLEESNKALQVLIKWRKSINQNDLDETALHELNVALLADWEILRQANNLTQDWHDTILPILQAMLKFTAPPEFHRKYPLPANLAAVPNGVMEIRHSWTQIYQLGIDAPLLETLEQDIESLRLGFYHWRQSLEHSDDRINRLLYHSHLDTVRQISTKWLRLSQHSHHARLSFGLLNKEEMYPSKTQIENLKDVLYHLGKMEDILNEPDDERCFPRWQTACNQILDAKTPEVRHQMVSSLPKDHPLFRWLVQLTFL
ncbi:MAG: hypothetical protein U9R53_08040 [Chloroflexota bacterium]|nr:hypothetical protein [Chloroflexota bacterium]